MKRVVREKTTRAYLSGGGQWVSDHRSAEDFANVELALSAVQGLMLKNVEMVLIVGEQPSDYDIALPLTYGGTQSPPKLHL